MKRQAGLWGICLILTVCVLVGGCRRREKKYEIALVVKSTQTEFFQLVYKGATAFAGQHNIELKFCGPIEESQHQDQKDIFEECVAEGQDAIVLAATDYYLFEEPVNQAGVPVILIDSSVKGDGWNTFVATDNYKAGGLLADEFIKRKGKEGKLAVISFVKNAESAIEREKGFLDGIRANSNIVILDTRYCQSRVETAQEIIARMLREDSEINMIAGMNAQSLLGAAKAVEAGGFQGRKLFLGGFDCLTEQIDYIESNVIDVCVLQNPYMIGYYGMENAWRILRGEKVQKNIWVDTGMIDKETVFEKKSQELIFPFD